MKFILFVLVILPCLISANTEFWRDYENTIKKISALKLDDVLLKDYDFEAASKFENKLNCHELPFSIHEPKSVHELRPNDIKVVAAIGDSLTAANGAKATNVLELLNEYRGVSWSSGGEENVHSVITLPNILRMYNPNIVGFSTGTGKYNSPVAGFNVGQPGHTSFEIYEQAQELVSRIKNSPEVNFEQDWKLVTLFIGGNDLCHSCKYPQSYTANNYYYNLLNTLNYLKWNMPRTLVNLVLSLDVTGISNFESTGFFCKVLTTAFCSCGLDSKTKDEVFALAKRIQKTTEDLINSGRYDDSDDFTVVLQPFMKDMTPPKDANDKYDLSFFAPDCFHFSKKGHQTAAIELWNNMFQPVGQKSTRWVQFEQAVKCPTTYSPYIFTKKNSQN